MRVLCQNRRNPDEARLSLISANTSDVRAPILGGEPLGGTTGVTKADQKAYRSCGPTVPLEARTRKVVMISRRNLIAAGILGVTC
jgi:hypothetical protein